MQKLQVLENLWYVAALSGELTGKPLARTICGVPMVLYRGENGNLVALEDRCPHRQAPLSMGNIIGDQIQCDYHGFMFDGAGACTHIPRQDKIPARMGVRAFAVVERWGFVWLWWGDREKADDSAIPHLPWTEEDHQRTQYF
ncbi:MAG: Rieske 2Fe-2S domain-containing protein, partial [Rhodospirillaceae bacterium]|nr:Rieske 2Fe-2S domain-containing protein [Rhodospirillaceae bacterium]